MIWMRRGDCPAVFSLEILRRNPCTGEESAPRETGRGTQQIFKQTGAAFCSRNTFAPRNGIFIQAQQSLARRGFKNQNPARGRKRGVIGIFVRRIELFKNQNPARGRKLLRIVLHRQKFRRFKNQNPARGRKQEIRRVGDRSLLFKNQNPARGRSVPPASPARAGERSTSSNHTSLTLVFLGRFPIRPVTQSAAPMGLLLGQVSRGTA